MSRPVAAVVVNYNAAHHLEACLSSILSDRVESAVVVDNCSTDDSELVTRKFPFAVWVRADRNLGYGRAANLGAAHPSTSGRDVLVCNPDLHWSPGVVATLASTLADDPSLGAVGPRLSNPDGSLYPSARTFPDMVDAVGHGLFGMVAPRNRFTRRYRLLDWDHSALATVDWVSGACFLARREAWDSVGGFDPGYFMYMEDVDLCWRLGRAGWKVAYQPAAEVVHAQGVSADQHPYRMLAAHHRSMWTFARRTTSGSRRAALPLIAAGLGARLIVSAGRRRLAGPAARGEAPVPGSLPGRPARSPLP